MIDAFLSRIIHVRMKTAFTGAKWNVKTQALHLYEGPLPQGLTIQKTYTEMYNGSKSIAIVMRNNMAYPQTLRRKVLVARIVAVNQVPEWQKKPGMMEALDKAQGIHHRGWL